MVAVLFAGGITWWMEFKAFDASFVGRGLDGRTIYTPTTGAGFVDIVGPPAPPWWLDPAVYALVAFVTVAFAAVVDACAVRRLIPGIVTVVAPFVALALFVLATPVGSSGWSRTTQSPSCWFWLASRSVRCECALARPRSALSGRSELQFSATARRPVSAHSPSGGDS